MFGFEQLMCPVWDAEVVYDEFLTMVRSNGIAEAPLLFEPEEVLSVTSADKTMQYEAGKDWLVQGNMLRLTEQSRIFAFDENEILFETKDEEGCMSTTDGKYSLFREGHFFHDRQISVTYRKLAGEADFKQEFYGEMLPETIKKLRNGEKVKIVLYGDSIAAGSNSSGMTLTTPFLPTWGELLAEKLRRYYSTGVEFINTSKGGKDSYWGIENAKSLVGDHNPDLAIIAFGMNDRDDGEQFAKNIKEIMNIITQTSPKAEFILCATTIPNLRLKNFYHHQAEYRDALETLHQKGIVIADFGRMQKYLMEKKRFIDLTGNNVNHPNDFMIRCHAQLIADMLIPR